jgi:hypothetical protein
MGLRSVTNLKDYLFFRRQVQVRSVMDWSLFRTSGRTIPPEDTLNTQVDP